MGRARFEETFFQERAGVRIADLEDDGDERREAGGEVLEDILAHDQKKRLARYLQRFTEGRPKASAAELERADLVDDKEFGRPGSADDLPRAFECRRDEDIRTGPLRPGISMPPEIGLAATCRDLDEVVADLAVLVGHDRTEEPGAGKAPTCPERQGAFEEGRLARMNRPGQDKDHRP
jgi:hypothetical protein